jgi:hypothetical protein
MDANGCIHVVWMNGENSGASTRHIWYNMHDPVQGWLWGSTGVRVDNQTRGGYASLGVNGHGYPFPAFHVQTPTSPLSQPHAAVAADSIPGAGRFSFWELPYFGSPVVQSIWPKIAVDRQGRIHLISTEQTASGVAGAPQRIFYCRGEFNPSVPTITFIRQIRVAWVETVAPDITASRHSDRVAIVFPCPRLFPQDTTQYNNDIYLIESEDGINWDFMRPQNITCFTRTDTLRAYADASVLYDQNDNLHVAFTTPYLDEATGTSSLNNSLIWHWSRATHYYSLVARYWSDYWSHNCGAWQRYVQRPCLAVDETTGDLFITYQKYDTTDVASNGYPQGDIMISRSTSGGTYWSVGTNVSNTHAPGASAGHCWSERDITCNETVQDSALHLLYVLDRDAGSIAMTEGSWTLNPVHYQRVSIDLIPATPLMPRYPMRTDSTGFPPPPPFGFLAVGDNIESPSIFYLAQNYPNPFNPVTDIRFELNRPGPVTLKVHNILGREVATLVNGHLAAGVYRVPFDASRLCSGVYFYRLTSSADSQMRKMVLLR